MVSWRGFVNLCLAHTCGVSLWYLLLVTSSAWNMAIPCSSCTLCGGEYFCIEALSQELLRSGGDEKYLKPKTGNKRSVFLLRQKLEVGSQLNSRWPLDLLYKDRGNRYTSLAHQLYLRLLTYLTITSTTHTMAVFSTIVAALALASTAVAHQFTACTDKNYGGRCQTWESTHDSCGMLSPRTLALCCTDVHQLPTSGLRPGIIRSARSTSVLRDRMLCAISMSKSPPASPKLEVWICLVR